MKRTLNVTVCNKCFIASVLTFRTKASCYWFSAAGALYYMAPGGHGIFERETENMPLYSAFIFLYSVKFLRLLI
jgi:hypothetical protein